MTILLVIFIQSGTPGGPMADPACGHPWSRKNRGLRPGPFAVYVLDWEELVERERFEPSVFSFFNGLRSHRVQHELDPTDRKPMLLIGSGVREIRIMHEGQYRVIYVTKIADLIYVLHAFQKKTQKTRKHDIDAVKQALKQLQNEV